MRGICIFSILFLTGIFNSVFGQMDTRAKLSASMYGIGGGIYQLPIASLNAHLSQGLGLRETFSGNVYYIGYDQGGYARAGDGPMVRVSSLLNFHYLIPQKIGGDSLNFTLRGYNMQFDGFSFNFLPSDRFIFTVGLGFTWGRVRIMREDASGKTDYRNPYFNPMLRSELSATLGERIVIGARAAYRHDWSKTRWKINAGSAGELPGTRLSGCMFGAFIAIRIAKENEESATPPPPPTEEPSKGE